MSVLAAGERDAGDRAGVGADDPAGAFVPSQPLKIGK